MKYFGKWSTRSTFIEKPYESNNKNELIRLMSKMAYGNVRGIESCYWEVWTLDENGNKKRIAEGGKGYGGKKWREDYSH